MMEYIRHLALVTALLMCAGCAQSVPLSPAPSVSGYAYRVGAGDRLRVMTFGEPSLSGEFAVNGAGRIAFPLLGEVEAGGKTIAEVREALREGLATSYLRNPNMTVEVINFRPVFVLGEVAKPGEFAFTERLTAYALIAKAGGFTYRADKRRIFVRHEDSPEERAYALTSDLVVQPGDTIRVGERYF